jgi:Uma2 family endonuclease
MSEKAFRKLALEDPEGNLELYCGEIRRKPGMTWEHNDIMSSLHAMLWQQLDRRQFRVRSNAGHVRISPQNYYIPDVFVIPMELQTPLRGTRLLEWYAGPLPLVVEIWSASTGNYDVETKLGQYQLRGDLEVWRLHPYERTLKAWRRQPDGSYVESLYTGGHVQPTALPGVTIDLDVLFDFA